MGRGPECACHRHQMMVPQERHHVWPLGYHGPDTRDNIIVVCCNAHSDIHYLMEAWLRNRRPQTRLFGVKVRTYAKQGYDAVMAYAESLGGQGETRPIVRDGTEQFS